MSPLAEVSMDREELLGLHAKYAQMRSMRLAHAAGEERPEEVRSIMARLASRFPGALREIDELELVEIERRIALLVAVLAGKQGAEKWMEAMALFHRFSRGALCAKRWLNGRRLVTDEVVASFRDACVALRLPSEALEWEAHLHALASPPNGRLTSLVHQRVAARLGVSVVEARALTFGDASRPLNR